MIQNAIGTLQNQLYQEVKDLSSRNLAELLNFVNYLKYRDSQVCTKEPVKFEGLWEAIPFEVTDEEVQVLRQQLSQQTEDKPKPNIHEVLQRTRGAWGKGKTLDEIDAEINTMRSEWERKWD